MYSNTSEMVQSDCPKAPIWKGRGSWARSSAKRTSTLWVEPGSSTLASATFQPERRRSAAMASARVSKLWFSVMPMLLLVITPEATLRRQRRVSGW